MRNGFLLDVSHNLWYYNCESREKAAETSCSASTGGEPLTKRENSKKAEKVKRVIQWHPAFYAAMQLELMEDKEKLIFENEHNLTKKPLQIDVLVIKKSDEFIVRNEIGRIFRRYNILEYKSPTDELGIDEFYKVLAYASLYKTQEEHVGDIPENEVTITFVRDSKPRKLLKWFENHHYPVKQICEGVYHIGVVAEFPVQLIVGTELSKENHVWLTSLTKKMDEEQAYQLVQSADRLSEKADKENADALLDVTIRANPKSFPKVNKEGRNMCDALMELMKPELDEARASGMAAGRETGRAEGHTAGIVAGRSEERIDRIADAISLGFSLEQIISLFHPTDEEMATARKRLEAR